jgi:HEAT repeat protein
MNTSDTRAPGAPRKRVRGTLLILLWAWVIVVFMTLDLFFNVSGFDSVRPRSETYRAARYAAHKMVGEEYVDGDFPNPQVNALPPLPPSALGNRSPAAVRLASELAAVRELEEARAIDDLREVATSAGDPRVRIAAMRGLANQAGAEARDLLRDCVLDASELDGVRAKAAMFIGRTGEDSMGLLEEILHSQLSDEIRAGAVLGLKELRSYAATERVLAIAAGPDAALRRAALRAISRSSSAAAAPLLMGAAQDPTRAQDIRVAACEGLAIGKRAETVASLVQVLADTSHPHAVRAAAANALGRMGRREALDAVTAACADASLEVVREATIAKSRLSRVKEEK